MATTIKTSPELWGDSAKEFDILAEENGKKPTPRLSNEEEQKLRDFLCVGMAVAHVGAIPESPASQNHKIR